MRKGINLVELASRIEGNKSLKQDYIAAPSALSMVDVGDASKPVMGLAVESVGTFPILPVAHGQVSEFTGIPRKYYDRMAVEAPALLANNVNTWFGKRGDDKRLVRTLGGDARALLSNRYQRIENEEIAEVALPILAEVPELQIVSCEITERRMYIQATTARGGLEVPGSRKVGDIVQRGVIISNSEVGHGSVSVAPMIYRLVCLNGMVSADGRLRAAHLGRVNHDTEMLLADDTKAAEDKAILLKVRDFVRAALDEAIFAQRVGKMGELAAAPISGDPVKAVEVLARKVDASEGEKGGILRSLIEGGDLSAWGLLNAVTAQAHTASDYDRSIELEATGGRLLDLARSEWREVLTAA